MNADIHGSQQHWERHHFSCLKTMALQGFGKGTASHAAGKYPLQVNVVFPNLTLLLREVRNPYSLQHIAE
ncbi:MAG TPA: hypothetical protein VFM10_00720, partial [Terriglobales bacterium]|nr:hypothetical protein [Terriglobales bacterium]